MRSFREEFSRTERSLTKSTAPIKEGLIVAVIDGIAHLKSDKWELDKMPEDLRERFLELMGKLTKGGESHVAIRGAVKQISEDEARALADKFLALSREVRNVPLTGQSKP